MTDATGATPTPQTTPPAPGVGLSSPLMQRALLHVKRAALCDFTRMSATEEERRALASAPLPVTTTEAQDYLAWRLSMAWVGLGAAALAALVALIEFLVQDKENLPGGVIFTFFVMQVGAKVALAVGLWATILRWKDAANSRRLLRRAWALGFFLPMAMGLVPVSEMFDAQGEEGRLALEGAKLLFGILFLILLAPSFLSLFPGGARAGLTMKTLFHGSGVGAIVTSMFAPLYSLGFVLAFVVLQQLSGSFLLVLGMAFVAVGPLVLVRHALRMVRPMSRTEAGAAVGSARTQSRWFLGAGFLLLLIASFDMRLLTAKLIGDVITVPTLIQLSLWYVATLTTFTAVASDAIVQGTTTMLARRPWWLATEEGRKAEDQIAAVSVAFPPPPPPVPPSAPEPAKTP